MSKNVLVVKCNKNIPFKEWDTVCTYIQEQVGKEYYVVGLLNGIDIECVTENDKVFYIDGDKYSYKSIKEAITSNNTIDNNNTNTRKEKNNV